MSASAKVPEGRRARVVTRNYPPGRKRAESEGGFRRGAPGMASAFTGGLLMEIRATPSLISMDTGDVRAMGGRDVVSW